MSTPPEFERTDADQVNNNIPSAAPNRVDEFRDVEKKTGLFLDSKTEHEVLDHSSDDFDEGRTAPIETAKDLVSKVIHVEDDKSLNPLTFRTIFLGRSKYNFSEAALRARPSL
jgi:hypothetical protein